jgi:hypothetical protein
VSLDKLPDFQKKVREVVAFRAANRVPDATVSGQGNGVGAVVNGGVVKAKGGDWKNGGYAENGTTAGKQGHLRYSELNYDLKTGAISVESFTDPAKATLSKAGFADQVTAMKKKDPKLSENDILSGLRAFSVYEVFEKEAVANGDKLNLLATLEVPIGANGAVMTHADYLPFNAQRTALATK